MAILNKESPEAWRVYSVKDSAPTLYAERPPAVFVKVSLALKDSPEAYTREYEARVLGSLVPTKVYADLHAIATKSGKSKVVLLCYESPEKFCHRHLVAQWLTDSLGAPVYEVNRTNAFYEGELL